MAKSVAFSRLCVLPVVVIGLTGPVKVTSAATYHVRADGAADTLEQAVGCESPATAMNVGTLNSARLAAGDVVILCSEGGVFRSSIYVSSDGSSENPIVYDGRGTAIVSGADIVTGWTVWSGPVYRATFPVSQHPFRPEQLFIDGQLANRRQGPDDLRRDGDWAWLEDTLLLYSSGGDPDALYSSPGIEAGRRDVCIGLADSDWVEVQGITVRHANHGGIWGFNPGSHVTVRDNVAEWNWNVGIILGGDRVYSHTVIEGNICRFNGIGGVALLNQATDARILSNRCYSNGKLQSAEEQFSDQHTWTYGIKLWDNQGAQHGHDIAFNEAFDNGRGKSGDYQDRGNGIWLDAITGDPERPILIRHNLVHDNRANGIFLEMSSHTMTYGNVLYNNASVGGGDQFAPANIAVDSREHHVTEDNLIANNTAVGGRYGLKIVTYQQQSGCSVRNNTIVNNIVVGASEHNLYANFGGDNDGVWGTGNVYENNAFGPDSRRFISWGGVGFDSYEAWDRATGVPSHSIAGDPQLAGENLTTLFVLPSSPCRDAGKSLAAPVAEGLRPSSDWPASISLVDQRTQGDGWEVGAYVVEERRRKPAGRRVTTGRSVH